MSGSDAALGAVTGAGPAIWFELAVIAALLLVSAFLAAAETAFHLCSKAGLKALSDRAEPNASLALSLAEERDPLGAVLLILGGLVKILAVIFATALFVERYGRAGPVISALVMTLVILALVELVPRGLARHAPEAVARRLAPAVGPLYRAFGPAVSLARGLLDRAFSLRGTSAAATDASYSAQDEIAGALALGRSAGTLEKEDRDRLMGALDLGDRWVEEIMLHRSKIEMVDADLPANEILDLVLASAHSRLPLYRGERENIVGVLHVKDLLRAVNRRVHNGGTLADVDVMAVAKLPYFIPETGTLDEQLREFLKRRRHFALVVDEYGSLRGLLTLEDIIEEIVGEIADEYDVEQNPTLRPNISGEYLVDGAMTIRDLNRALDWHLPDEEANTVAGLVIHMAQSIPMPGQVFSFEGFRFEVLGRRENRITRLRIKPIPAPPR